MRFARNEYVFRSRVAKRKRAASPRIEEPQLTGIAKFPSNKVALERSAAAGFAEVSMTNLPADVHTQAWISMVRPLGSDALLRIVGTTTGVE
jgi:hypothetical protein